MLISRGLPEIFATEPLKHWSRGEAKIKPQMNTDKHG
jgi:hypothetical protein